MNLPLAEHQAILLHQKGGADIKLVRDHIRLNLLSLARGQPPEWHLVGLESTLGDAQHSLAAIRRDFREKKDGATPPSDVRKAGENNFRDSEG